MIPRRLTLWASLAAILLLDTLLQGAPLPKAPSSTENVNCCWCISRWTGESEIWKYSGRRSCENRSKTALYRTCRQVEVNGEACSFVKVSARSRRRIHCTERELYYWEEGKLKQIPPPQLTACQARKITEFSGNVLVAEEARLRDGMKGAGESVCRCGPAPFNRQTCVASRTVDGVATEDMTVLKPGETDCQRACKALFAESAILHDCTHFQH